VAEPTAQPIKQSRRSEVIVALTILIGTIGILSAVEILLRAQTAAQFGNTEGAFEQSPLYAVDQKTGLRRLNPGARSGKISVNREGFRGPEIAAQSAGNIVQIAFVGHSTTLDPYSGETQNWPFLVSRAIGSDIPDCRVELINGGVPGYGTSSMLRYFDAYVRSHKPVFTFLLTADYNTNFNRQAKAQGVSTSADVRHSWLAANSLLFAKIEKNSRAVMFMRSAYSEVGKLHPDWESAEREFRGTMTEAIEHIASSGSQVAVLTSAHRLRADQTPQEQISAVQSALEFSPYFSIPEMIEAHTRFNRVIEGAAHSSNAILIADENSIPGTPAYWVDSSHFSATGSRLMAARVMRQLHSSQQYRDLIERLVRGCRAIGAKTKGN